MASMSQSSPLSNADIASNQSSGSEKASASENQGPILTKSRLKELVREVDLTEELDEEVEELLLKLAGDFVEDTVKNASALAKHRKVSKVEIRDVQLYLESKWNMWIPGFGTYDWNLHRRATVTEAHKQRLALVRKMIKKY